MISGYIGPCHTHPNRQSHKAIMIHTLRPVTYELFFKMAKKLMFTQLFKLITKFNVLYDQQYGFCSKHGSTQHSILDIVNTILCNALVKNIETIWHWPTVCFNSCQTSNVWHPSITTFLTSAFRSYFIFLNCQAYLLLRNSTLASRSYS